LKPTILVVPMLIVDCMTPGLLILAGMTLARVELKRVVIKSEEKKEARRSMILFFLCANVEICLIYVRDAPGEARTLY
jgi:hypothetical protein